MIQIFRGHESYIKDGRRITSSMTKESRTIQSLVQYLKVCATKFQGQRAITYRLAYHHKFIDQSN